LSLEVAAPNEVRRPSSSVQIGEAASRFSPDDVRTTAARQFLRSRACTTQSSSRATGTSASVATVAGSASASAATDSMPAARSRSA